VRVTDPRAPAPRAEPEAAPAPAPAPARARVGRAPAAALLLCGAALGFGAAELLHAQRERAAERAAVEALDLRLETASEFFGSTSRGADGEVGLVRDLRVRNVGPRPVQLLGAELVGGSLATRSVDRRVPAGEPADLQLATRLHCTPGTQPSVAPPGSVLRVRARTAVGERSVDLPVPEAVLQDLQGTAGRLCGYVPVSRALVAGVDSELVRGEQLVLRLSLSSATAAPLRLLGIDLQVAGLRATVLEDRRPVRLPVQLESPALIGLVDGGFGEALRLDVDVDVTDCAALREEVDQITLGGTTPLFLLGYEVEGEDEQGSTLLDDRGGLDPLLAAACG